MSLRMSPAKVQACSGLAIGLTVWLALTGSCMCLPLLPAVLAYFVAALSPNMDVANAALPVYVSTLLFFGGFLFTFDKMPPWWKWYSYINFMR